MTKQLFPPHDNEDISVTKMEVALRAGWNTFHLAGDLRGAGQAANATSAEDCARIAYGRAFDLLPKVVDDTARSILARAVEQLKELLRPPV